MEIFDAAVLGLGALGSATLFQLSRRGVRVLGIDQFAPPHPYGSSHGATRITREAIGEGRHLTPIAQRSHQLWREIEHEAGVSLFSATGLLILSGAERTSYTHVPNFFANTIAAAREHKIPHELLDASEIRRRFSQFRLRDDESGYWEPGGGYVRPEECIAAQLGLARKYGAKTQLNEHVSAFHAGAEGVILECANNTYCARTLIVAAGPWLPGLLESGPASAFRVFRQTTFWYPASDDSFGVEQFPVFIWELSGRSQPLYGFPDIDGAGVKIATEQFETATHPANVDRNVSPAECGSMHQSYVAPFLPALGARCTRASACLYTVTSDFNFVIDRHPDDERVILASCCSGHGFKHSAALGEALAEITLEGKSRLDLAPFRRTRSSVY